MFARLERRLAGTNQTHLLRRLLLLPLQSNLSLHDPRVQGAYASWLTHTETQGNNSATDINVDAFHQKIHLEIHCGTPFGDQFLPEADTWNELYKRVGNIFYGNNNKDKTTSNKKSLSSTFTNNKSWVDSTSRPIKAFPP